MLKWIAFSMVYLAATTYLVLKLFMCEGYIVDFEKNTLVLSQHAVPLGGAALALMISVLSLYFVVHGTKCARDVLALRYRMYKLSRQRTYWEHGSLLNAARRSFVMWTEAERFGRAPERPELFSSRTRQEIEQYLIMRKAGAIAVDDSSRLKVTFCRVTGINDVWPVLETFTVLIRATVYQEKYFFQLETECLLTRKDNQWLLSGVYETEKATGEVSPCVSGG